MAVHVDNGGNLEPIAVVLASTEDRDARDQVPELHENSEHPTYSKEIA